MPRHISPRIIEPLIASKQCHLMHVVLLSIVFLFVVKQGFDVNEQWEIAEAQTLKNATTESSQCVKEYNDKLCHSSNPPP
jgi:hypothetical protein